LCVGNKIFRGLIKECSEHLDTTSFYCAGLEHQEKEPIEYPLEYQQNLRGTRGTGIAMEKNKVSHFTSQCGSDTVKSDIMDVHCTNIPLCHPTSSTGQAFISLPYKNRKTFISTGQAFIVLSCPTRTKKLSLLNMVSHFMCQCGSDTIDSDVMELHVPSTNTPLCHPTSSTEQVWSSPKRTN